MSSKPRSLMPFRTPSSVIKPSGSATIVRRETCGVNSLRICSRQSLIGVRNPHVAMRMGDPCQLDLVVAAVPVVQVIFRADVVALGAVATDDKLLRPAPLADSNWVASVEIES